MNKVPHNLAGSVIVLGTLQFAPPDRAKFLAIASVLRENALAQPECLRYEQLPEPGDLEHVHVIEHWANGEAFAAHVSSSYFRDFTEQMRRIPMLREPDIDQVEVHSTYALSASSEPPSA